MARNLSLDRLTNMFGAGRPERPGWAQLVTLERALVVAALGVMAGAFVPLLQRMAGMGVDVSVGDRTTQALLLPPYVFAVGWLVVHPKRSGRTAMRCLPMLLLLAIAVASANWSSERDITVRRSLALIVTTAFGLYLATRFSGRELLQLLAWTVGLAAVTSLLTVALMPAYGITPGGHEGAWRGIFSDKNVLGRIMVLGTTVFVLLAKDAPARLQGVYWAAGVLSAVLVVFSRSTTAIIVVLCLLGLLPFYVGLRWRTSARWLMLTAGVLVAYLVLGFLLTDWQQSLVALGKDSTLTGRTALWLAVLKRIYARPWLGYGYSAFWVGWSGASAGVWEDVAWEPPHSHNGLLDLCLDLGLLGVALFLLGFVGVARRAFAAARAAKTADGVWPLAMVTFMLLYNLTESALVKQNSIFWALYAATAFATAAERAKRAERARRAQADLAAETVSGGQGPWSDHVHETRGRRRSSARATLEGPKASLRIRRLQARVSRSVAERSGE